MVGLPRDRLDVDLTEELVDKLFKILPIVLKAVEEGRCDDAVDEDGPSCTDHFACRRHRISGQILLRVSFSHSGSNDFVDVLDWATGLSEQVFDAVEHV